MRLQEIDTVEVRENLPQALRQAVQDVPILESVLKDAERKLGSAEGERQRCNRLFGSYQSRIILLGEKLKAAKLRAFEASARETDDPSTWKEFVQLKIERQRATDVFQYISVYAREDADRAHIVAEIGEREAAADLLEAQAVKQRIGMANAASSALEYDPGASISVDGSWSDQQLEKVRQIRSRVIPDLRKRLEEHDARISRERELVATSLWS